MITIIIGTYRKDSLTSFLSEYYISLFKEKNYPFLVFDIREHLSIILSMDSKLGEENTEVKNLLKTYISPSSHLLFIIPEYNGSFPGIVKTWIDLSPPIFFKDKKVGLTGVATGRAGNLRGMDHLSDIMQYMGAFVHPNKLPISQFHTLIDEKRKSIEAFTQKRIKDQLDAFLDW